MAKIQIDRTKYPSVSYLEEENKRLKAENERLLQKLQQAQEDTVKELIDRFDKKIFPLGTFHDLNYPINAKEVKCAYDKIAEEMVGEDK